MRAIHEVVVDPAVHPWVFDHRPTYTRPALPFAFLLDLMAQGARALAPGEAVVGCEGVTVLRWVPCDGRTRLEVAVRPGEAGRHEVEVREGGQPVARGAILLAPGFPAAPAWPSPAAAGGVPVADLYEEGPLFHGPSMRVVSEVRAGERGTEYRVDAGRHSLPYGALNPLLLDGLVQGAPLSGLERWLGEVEPGQVGYPYRLERARFFAPAPLWGSVRARAAVEGIDGAGRFPRYSVRAWTPEGAPWAELELVAALFSTGPVGRAPHREVKLFTRDRRFVPGLGISRFEGGATRLAVADVRASNWFPGTVREVYGTEGDPESRPEEVAVRDHVAQRAEVHPSAVSVGPEASLARAATLPLNPFRVVVAAEGERVTVTDGPAPGLDVAALRDLWCARTGAEPWAALDTGLAISRRFLGRLRLARPDTLARLGGRGCLYLANHQTGVESAFASFVLGALTGRWVVGLAKLEHEASWLGRMMALAERHPAVPMPPGMRFFDRSRKEELLPLLAEVRRSLAEGGESLLVHVEGTRSTHCRRPVQKMSSAFVDLAVQARLPIVPLRFSGGLPTEGEERLEFPLGFGRQELHVGDPLEPDELAALPYAERTHRVVEAINSLGPGWETETPSPPDPAFAAAVREWSERTGASPEHAALLGALRELPEPGRETARLLEGCDAGRLALADDPAGRWLAELARPLFGPRGPEVVLSPGGPPCS